MLQTTGIAFFCKTYNDDIDINGDDDDDDPPQKLPQRVFGNYLHIPGPGHIEIKLARVLLDNFGAPLLDIATKTLGFCSP